MVPQFDLSSDALPPAARVRAVRGTERLSQPYAFDLVVELDHGALEDLDAPVGKPATVTFNDEHGFAQDEVHGIIASLELVDALPDRELFLARLVPRLWWLGQNRHSRVFVDEKLPAIINRVLRAAGWGDDDFRLQLKGRGGKGYPVLEHVCQYRESDLDFLSRWMEREGVYYCFEEGRGGREKLVILDHAEAHRSRDAGPRRYVPRSAAGGDRVNGFHSFRRTSHAQPAGVRLADYDYLNPEVAVEHHEKSGEGPVVSLFGENLRTTDDAKWLTKVRMQELRAQQVIYRGAGRVHGIHPGDRFSLDEHPRLTDEMLATEVVHRGMDLEGQPGLRDAIEEALGEELADGYVAEVVAIPAAVQYRPPRVTPTPRVTGMESAVVDGATSERYAQLDEHGRYNVRLKFDESDLEDGRASSRVRMLQPHGGAEEGFHFPLRKGTEVMVTFVGGDPDRPMICGVTPNARAQSPVTQANATQNVIQTGGGNRIVMEDTAGAQAVDASSPALNSSLHLGAGENNLELSTDGVGRIHTGSDLRIEVGGARTDTVALDLTETYEGAQTTTVARRKETVKGPVTEEYQGFHMQTVTQGGVLRDVTGHELEILHDGRLQIIESGDTQTITGGLDQKIDGGMHQRFDNGAVKIDVAGGKVTIDAAGDITLKSKGYINQEAKQKHLVNTPVRLEISDLKATVSKSFIGTLTPSSLSVVPGVNVSRVGFGFSKANFVANHFNLKQERHVFKQDRTLVADTTTQFDLNKGNVKVTKEQVRLMKAIFTILG